MMSSAHLSAAFATCTLHLMSFYENDQGFSTKITNYSINACHTAIALIRPIASVHQLPGIPVLQMHFRYVVEYLPAVSVSEGDLSKFLTVVV